MFRKTKRKKFCTRPFEWFEVQRGKKAYFCCPGWVNIEGVDIENKPALEAWNSPVAQKFRESIHDGSFRYCVKDRCFFLSRFEEIPVWWERGGSPFKDADKISDLRLREIMNKKLTVLSDGPFAFVGGYDKTCNLSCPSCRDRKVVSSKEEIQSNIAFQKKIFDGLGKNLRLLYLSGVGDPFASPVYFDLLQNLSYQEYPDLEIHLGTNGLLWTPKIWEAMHKINRQIKTADISIDAASPETYAKNRRGGSWASLMENLKFISRLRREGALRFVLASFVVQRNNYHEMPAFIEIIKNFGFDLVHFHKICDWKAYPMPEYKKRAIHYSANPEHHLFLKELSSDYFERPDIVLTCLYKYRHKALNIKRLGNFGFKALNIVTLPLRVFTLITNMLYYIARSTYRRLKKIYDKLRALKQCIKLLLRSNFHYWQIEAVKSPFWVGLPGKARRVYADSKDHQNNLFIYKEILLYDTYGIFDYRRKASPALIVDIGAHVGMFSVLCSVLFPRATIYAYEANLSSSSFLKKNSKNTNIRVFNLAILDKHGIVTLDTAGKRGDTNINSGGAEAVKCIPASEIAEGRTIDLLKMDCEGSEWVILQDEEFLRRVRNLRMEYHLNFEQNVQELCKLIERAGHRILYISPPCNSCEKFKSIGTIWSKSSSC